MHRQEGDWEPSGAATVSSSLMEFTIPGLDNGMVYRVRLLAMNSQGDGKRAVATQAPGFKPEQLGENDPMLAPDDMQITVTWTGLGDDDWGSGPADSTGYVVDWGMHRQEGDWEPSGADTIRYADGLMPQMSHRIDGLKNGTLYRVRVLAINIVGEGMRRVKTATPMLPVHTVMADAATGVGAGALVVSWEGHPASTDVNLRVQYQRKTEDDPDPSLWGVNGDPVNNYRPSGHFHVSRCATEGNELMFGHLDHCHNADGMPYGDHFLEPGQAYFVRLEWRRSDDTREATNHDDGTTQGT